jgi:hypothetical protein
MARKKGTVTSRRTRETSFYSAFAHIAPAGSARNLFNASMQTTISNSTSVEKYMVSMLFMPKKHGIGQFQQTEEGAIRWAQWMWATDPEVGSLGHHQFRRQIPQRHGGECRLPIVLSGAQASVRKKA